MPSMNTTSFTTEVLPCDPVTIEFSPNSDQPQISSPQTLSSLKRASEQLLSLQCVAFPTETVYGLGALALNSSAASKIFTTKGRPPDNPLIVHVSSFAMLRKILPKDYILPESYEILMKHFWPGALTLLFPSDPTIIPEIITANHPTVAIRMPSHPVARALISVADAPIAAPSANSSGKPSPTKAEHVLRDLDGKVGLILDGGGCGVGLESTVVDGLNADGNIRVLRPGGITVEEIKRVIKADTKETDGRRVPDVLVHRRDYRDEAMEMAPTTPGMKYRHYSPSVPVTLLCTSSLPPDVTEPTSVSTFLGTLGGAIYFTVPQSWPVTSFRLPTRNLPPSNARHPMACIPTRSHCPSIHHCPSSFRRPAHIRKRRSGSHFNRGSEGGTGGLSSHESCQKGCWGDSMGAI